jgi:hypothetical protein
MKKIVLLITLASLSLSVDYDGCGIGLFFGNGMRYEKENAKSSLDSLKYNIRRYDKQLYDSFRFDIAYNHKEALLLEIFEVIAQWINQFELNWIVSEYGYNFHQIMSYIDGDDIPPEDIWVLGKDRWIEFRDEIRVKIAKYANEQYASDPDLREHVKQYKASVSKSAGMILVAHSQGNFYGNLAYLVLEAFEKDRFRMHSVGTPADKVLGKLAQYTTLVTDYFMRLVPFSLPPNMENDVQTIFNYETLQLEMGPGAGHYFDYSYLAGNKSGPKIIAHIAEAANSIYSEPSVWQVSEETDKNTCDHRVKVKNNLPMKQSTTFIRSRKTANYTRLTTSGYWQVAAARQLKISAKRRATYVICSRKPAKRSKVKDFNVGHIITHTTLDKTAIA